MTTLRLRARLILTSLSLLHCSAAVGTADSNTRGGSGAGGAPQTSEGGRAGATSSASAGTAGTSLLLPDPSDIDAGPQDDCTDAAKLVYVVSEDNDLYSFAPDKLLFTKLGRITCGSKTVNSMAVDRSGTAWVNFSDGKIFKVDTATLACTPTGFVPQQAGFTKVLGMGFSANAAGSSSETLFIADNSGKGVGKLDQTTMKLSALGPYTGELAGSDAELTGTGDARLFGFFTTSPAHFAAVDKTTGATPAATLLPGVDASSGGFAFSFWGGDFWFYTANDPDGDGSTTVSQYVSSTQQTKVGVLKNIGFVIVGAGVSTCAPVEPPVPK